jgi:hypothetical protein
MPWGINPRVFCFMGIISLPNFTLGQAKNSAKSIKQVTKCPPPKKAGYFTPTDLNPLFHRWGKFDAHRGKKGR